MGNFRWIIIPVLFMIVVMQTPACSSDSGAESPEDMARMAFEALKTGSPDPMKPCIATSADLEEMMELVRETGTPKEYEGIRDYVDQSGGPAKLAEQMSSEFGRILGLTLEAVKTDSPAMDWSKAEFGGIDESKTKRKTESGIEQADFFFKVKAGETETTFRLAECVKVKRGWLCLSVRPGYATGGVRAPDDR